MNWTNFTGIQVEVDTGDTGDCTTFIETFTINSSYIAVFGTGLNVSLTGTNLEGADNASVQTAGTFSLLLTNLDPQGTFLGLGSSVQVTIKDENDKKITGGRCNADIKDPSTDQAILSLEALMLDGDAEFEWILESDEFPIYGRIQTEPTWDLRLFDPLYYRIPEAWTKISTVKINNIFFIC